MSKQQETASALASILRAKREPEPPAEPEAAEVAAVAPEPAVAPSPAPPPVGPKNRRGGKSSDPEYLQCSVYLPRKLRRLVNRALDDEDKGRDFSGLVKDLLSEWISSRT